MGRVEVYKHQDVVSNLIYDRGYEKVAEIGVYEGGMIKRVLTQVGEGIKEYWAIDPWARYTHPAFREWATWGQEVWDKKYLKTCQRLFYFPQLRIIRARSLQASTLFSDGYFDFIYLDGDHQYEGVISDIEAWLPKVKRGGILAGHDYKYNDGRGSRSRCEVEPAVNDYFGKENIVIEEHRVWYKEI